MKSKTSLFKLLFSLLFLFSASTNLSQAMTACSNQPVTLNWSSSGCISNFQAQPRDNPLCAFNASQNSSGNRYPIILSSGSCTVDISCSNGQTANAQDTLTIDTTRIWNGSACASNSPRGTHDYISTGNNPVSYGWAIDDDEPNTTIGIHFYIDGPYGSGTFIGATSAGTFRGDGGIGNHGYEWSIPTQYCNGTTRNVYAYGINVGATGYSLLLAGNPKSFSCNPPAGTGNISANPNPCTIAVGASNCTSVISWSSANNTNPTVAVDYNYGPSGLMSGAANGSTVVPWISYGGNVFELRNGTSVLASVAVRGVCDSGSGSSWNGSVCAVPVPGEPTLNVSRNPNYGVVGSAYNLVWSSTNATSLAYSCSGPFNGSGSVPLNGNNGTEYYPAAWVGTTNCTWTATGPGGSVTAQDTFTVLALSTPSYPSGNISATPCIITIGASSCSSIVSWNTQNLTNNPTAVTYPSGITLSTLTNSRGVSNTVSGFNVVRDYFLYHNGVLLDQTSIISACDTGSDWNGNSCVAGTCDNGANNYPTCNIFPPCANGLNSSYRPLCACSDVQEKLLGSDRCTFKVNTGPVKISTFLIQPSQIACPGGNDEATLRFILNNTPGKTCRMSAKEISVNPILSDKTEQITTLNSDTQLKSNKYRSSNSSLSGYTKTFEQLIKDTTTGASGGEIIMKAPKFDSGKRLFNYSTRFTIECGSLAEPIATRYVKTNASYSTKSVDMLSTCIGQD